MKAPYPFFLCLVMTYLPLSGMTITPLNTEDEQLGYVSMDEFVRGKSMTKHEIRILKKSEQKQVRVEKQIARLEKNFQNRMEKKSLGSINDPVDRWFWYWGISWGLGILISIFAAGAIAGTGIGILWWLLFAIGSVSLVIWLVKKFG